MATYSTIFQRANDATIRGQLSVALATEAKYKIQTSADPNEKAWACWVIPRTYPEAINWQTAVCTDPRIADAVEVRDEDVQGAVTALVPTMIESYLSQRPTAT